MPRGKRGGEVKAFRRSLNVMRGAGRRSEGIQKESECHEGSEAG
ncbi:hypothetical protein [Gracilibacillus oryzae]|nr:hypothetical protein [Gracilibacillus oryzae]